MIPNTGNDGKCLIPGLFSVFSFPEKIFSKNKTAGNARGSFMTEGPKF